MEEKYKLLSAVLQKLQEEGVLNGLVIVGSWCQYYYRILFDNAPEIPLIRTMDIDFLVPNPSMFKNKVDVSDLLNALGFDSDFDYSTGLVKYVHPDLEIQFLTPASGRVKDTPYEIKQLNINAEGLTYMKMLQDYRFSMTHHGVTVWLPEPEAFCLHKILISHKRKNPEKKEKVLMAAKSSFNVSAGGHRCFSNVLCGFWIPDKVPRCFSRPSNPFLFFQDFYACDL